MSAVSKLVRWLPKAVEATADDIARFGPQAGRVRQLLDFLPDMSSTADFIAGSANIATRRPATSNAGKAAWNAAEAAYQRTGSMSRARREAAMAADEYLWDPGANTAAADAATAEAVGDLVTPEVYRILTNPLNAGRAFDLLQNRPRYQGTPFMDVVQQLAGRGVITGPRDVVRAGRIARAPQDVREIALTLIADGMSPADALRAARML